MRWILIGMAIAVVMNAAAHAQIPLPRFGREEPVQSVLARVRDPAFQAERCVAPAGDEQVPDEEGFDLVDLWVSAVGPVAERAPPDGARYNFSPIGLERADNELKQLLNQLVQVQPPPGGLRADVVIDPERTVDARQTSAGHITLSLGLIDALRQRPPERRTADTMFVLAHEYSHVLLCHYTGRMARARNARALRTASTLGLVAIVFSNSRAEQTANGIAFRSANDERAGDQMLALLAGMTLMRSANSVIVNPAWSRGEERDADRLAVELMREAGQPTTYVAELLGVLHEADDLANGRLTDILSAVPVQALMALSLSMQETGQNTLEDRLRFVALNTGVQAFQAWRRNQLRHFHDPPQRRVDSIDPLLALREQEQGARDQERIQQNSQFAREWQQAFDAGYDADMQAYTLAQEADRLFAQGDFDGGCASATAALQADGDDFAALLAASRCAVHRGEFASADRSLDRAMRSRLAMPNDFSNICVMWLEAQQRQRAETALQRGSERYPGRFYSDLMVLHAQYDEYDRVAQVAQECADSQAPQPVKEECASTQQWLARRHLQEQQQQQQQGAQAAAAAAAPPPEQAAH